MLVGDSLIWRTRSLLAFECVKHIQPIPPRPRGVRLMLLIEMLRGFYQPDFADRKIAMSRIANADQCNRFRLS